MKPTMAASLVAIEETRKCTTEEVHQWWLLEPT